MLRAARVLISLAALLAAETGACVVDLAGDLLRDPGKHIAQATWVFSGEIAELQEARKQEHRVTVVVHSRFKGDFGERVVVRTNQNGLGLTCFHLLSVGREYVFFGHRAADGEVDVIGWLAAPELLAAIEAAVVGKEPQP